MSLVAWSGTPLISLGAVHRQGYPGSPGFANVTVDAALEAVIMVGRIVTEDGGSHTLDTTGSSSIGWRSGTTTFANAGTSVKVGLAAVDAAAGPPARAANVTNTITFDVSRTLTGGAGGIANGGWNSSVPDTGTKTVAHGDLVALCVQMVTRGGADSFLVSISGMSATQGRPCVTGYLGGAYADQLAWPNALIIFSDGTRGWFWGDYVASGHATITWNSGSATKEYGNLLQFPFPVRIYGICAGYLTLAGDADLVLYSDPLGTPVAERTASIDLNTIAVATATMVYELFSSPYDLAPNTPVAAIVKPTTVTNILLIHLSLNAAADQIVWGANSYAVNRASGAFAAQNSSKDRFGVGVLVAGFDTGGYPASRMRLGM